MTREQLHEYSVIHIYTSAIDELRKLSKVLDKYEVMKTNASHTVRFLEYMFPEIIEASKLK